MSTAVGWVLGIAILVVMAGVLWIGISLITALLISLKRGEFGTPPWRDDP